MSIYKIKRDIELLEEQFIEIETKISDPIERNEYKQELQRKIKKLNRRKDSLEQLEREQQELESLKSEFLLNSNESVDQKKSEPDKPVEYASSTTNNSITTKSKTEVSENIEPNIQSFPSLQVFKFDVVTVTIQQRSGQITLNRSRSQAEYFKEDLGNGVILEMISIPGGSFMMGAPLGEKFSQDRERPQHRVTIKPFLMGKFQVTQAEWRAVASLPKVNRDLNLAPSSFKGHNLPVENVSWHDAVEFCARLSKRTGREYRLPSEAEWEYACRAGTNTPFHFGETITRELANYNQQRTAPLGQFPPNAFGLYDMHGNVWERCADTWHKNYKGASIDGSAWIERDNDNYSPLRGGSWLNYPFNCRSAFRNINARDARFDFIGFRVVCVAPRIT